MTVEQSEFVKAGELFQRELYSLKSKDGLLTPLACRIHDAFCGLNAASHNCLGCNFADATIAIDRVLKRIAEGNDFRVEYDYGDYIMSLYLFIERADMVLGIIGLKNKEDGKNSAYYARQFGVFREIRRWANFLKHPNYFILVHHPKYQAGGTVDRSAWEQVVDTEFVMENYGADSDSKAGKIKAAFVNKTRVLVQFPDVVPLTERFCTAAKIFVSVIADNPVFREMLDDMSTYDKYFDPEIKPAA